MLKQTLEKRILQFIFLLLPTLLFSTILFKLVQNYFSIQDQSYWQQSFYLGIGMISALIFYSFSFRFLPTFSILLIIFYSIYKGIDATAWGEFDSYFYSIQFLIFSTLFSLGWLISAGFLRFRYTHYLLAALVLVVGIVMLAKQKIVSIDQLYLALLPLLIYCFYILFAAEQIYQHKDLTKGLWLILTKRSLLFLILLGLSIFLISKYLQPQLKDAIAQANSNAEQGENGMLKKNKNGDFDLKDYSRLRGNQNRSNELLFAAHIDNFLPGTDIPNPVYLTAFYYSKFDTASETFERDAKLPKNDLFEPNVSKIPLYSTKTDSSVIKNGMAEKGRRVIDIEVYNKMLSPETFLAPNIGFFVQPIAIEKDFRNTFKSAYRAKSYVSELNSAYFVYNANDIALKVFQEQRFKVLRQAVNYEHTDKTFMSYYTQMPKDAKFEKIAQLAHKIADQAPTTVDKVIALRDYFLSKDEQGKALFSYTDNPGVPDIPSASKLMYFLFENHKGYCAYYAGATLFMLRALGIPSRITVGFMTVDRSDKNKGWYWYYADQAHAWVQVYFPGFGWLDFDTTVGNDDAQESPTPDGTPPMQPPHPYWVAKGNIIAIDTSKKTVQISTHNILFKDHEYTDHQAQEIKLDIHIAHLQKDSVSIKIQDLKQGDSLTAISYASELKNIDPTIANSNLVNLIKTLPLLIPTDEIFIHSKDKIQNKETNKHIANEATFSWVEFAKNIGIILIIGFILFFCLPLFLLGYYLFRARLTKQHKTKAFWYYTAFLYYLHQLGFKNQYATHLEYAVKQIDPQLNTNFATFMQQYLALKYNPQQTHHNNPLNSAQQFWKTNTTIIKKKISLKKRLLAFLRPLRCLAFFRP